MKRDQLEQYVNEFKNIDSIQKMEDKIIENYPYLDKIDINDIIIGCLGYQNGSSIQAKRESLEEMKTRINEIQERLQTPSIINALANNPGNAMTVAAFESLLIFATSMNIYAMDHPDKMNGSVGFGIFITTLISLASMFVACNNDFDHISSLNDDVKDLRRNIKEFKLQIEKEGITKKDLKDELKRLKKEYKTLSIELEDQEMQGRVNARINKYDEEVEQSKQKELLTR